MSSGGTAVPGPEGTPSLPGLQIVGQYIKDLSFENPGAPAGLTQQPQIEFGIDVQAKRGDEFHFEVELKLRVHAKSGDRQLFLLELAYAGLFRLQNIPEDAMQPILLIQAPHMLFPFARRIVADVVRDGGMPPLMIEPIDFVALFQAKMGQAGQQPIMGNA
ncbi:MAG TPA: protein-export chaperone SecB [Rhizomicrobium sp.]|jgi:preprotein translocase subunit SecB|nr:protein-export chaperone SecB [Rhizomicrobium sp.]